MQRAISREIIAMGRIKQMRSFRLCWFLAIVLVLGITVGAQTPTGQGGAPQAAGGRGPAPKPLVMTITGFADGSDIPLKYTGAGDQTSPEILWASVPAGTVSFLLHMHDMEVSRNHTTDDQLHWLVWNIPGTATKLAEGIPMGVQLDNGAYQISATRLDLSRSRCAGYRPAASLHFLSFLPWTRSLM